MSTQNNQMIADLLRAGRAIRFLKAQDVTVHTVLIGERNPKILIESPASPFLVGSLTKRVTMAGKHHCTYAAPVFGCQVEWIETHSTKDSEAAHA